MDHSQLKMTAVALWGFEPKWSPRTCGEILKRIDRLGVPAAAYLRAVSTNKKVPGHAMSFEHVILSPKWDQFVKDELQQMENEARVRMRSDMVEFRNALAVCGGDYRMVLEDTNFDISCLGRNRIAKMYGLEDIAERFDDEALRDSLRNPCLPSEYDKLQEDDK